MSAKKHGWDCDNDGCRNNAADGPLWRMNPKGEKGIFFCTRCRDRSERDDLREPGEVDR